MGAIVALVSSLMVASVSAQPPTPPDRFTGPFLISCWAIALAYNAIASLATKRTAETSGVGIRERWRTALVLVIIAAVGIVSTSTSGPLSFRQSHELALGIAADVAGLCGVIVMVWARTVLGGNWAPRAVIKEDHELMQRGPYRYVRHPMYSGLLLMILGSVTWYGSVAGIVVLAAFCGAFWVRARAEEELLTKHFGDAYREYKARVRAFVPFVF